MAAPDGSLWRPKLDEAAHNMKKRCPSFEDGREPIRHQAGLLPKLATCALLEALPCLYAPAGKAVPQRRIGPRHGKHVTHESGIDLLRTNDDDGDASHFLVAK